MTPTLEITVIEQPELLQVVKDSRIELSKAESYAIGYAPFMIQINELSQAIKTIDKDNPTPEMAATARRKRLGLVKVRSAAVAKKDTDKEIILIETRLIDGLFKVVENTSKLTEAEYLEIEKHQERIENERLEKLEIERKLLLEPYGTVNQFVDLKAMDEDTFQTYLSKEKIAFHAKQEADRKAEKQRIADEKKAIAEQKAKEKAEALERERIRKENEELKKINEAKEKELSAERDRAAKENLERDRLAKIESDKQAKINADLKAENDRIAKELQDKKDAEQKEQEQEKQRIQKESADRIAKEKAAQLAPDKEKVNAMYLSLKAFVIPEFTTTEAQHIGQTVREGIEVILTGIKELSSKLK
jgi:hypothetical protein